MFKFLSGFIAVIVAIALFAFFTGYFVSSDDVQDTAPAGAIHQ